VVVVVVAVAAAAATLAVVVVVVAAAVRKVTSNRPNIIIENKKEKTCPLIDVAIPADRNVVQKEAEKKLKYKSLV